MKTLRWTLCLGIMALFGGLCSFTAYADLYIETENVSTNLPHQSNGASTLKNYFNSTGSRVELGNGKVFILDYDSMKLFKLNPKAKTYKEMKIGKIPGIPDVNVTHGQQKGIDEAIASIMAIQVVPTNETKTIQGYNCRKYCVSIPMVSGEYWVSKDVKGYEELRAIGAKVASVLERNPTLRQFDIAGMTDKLDGFPVYMVNHVMGGTVESTVRKVEQRPLDPALFRVPRDYAKK